jgi:hypothetical protein
MVNYENNIIHYSSMEVNGLDPERDEEEEEEAPTGTEIV